MNNISRFVSIVFVVIAGAFLTMVLGGSLGELRTEAGYVTSEFGTQMPEWLAVRQQYDPDYEARLTLDSS